MTGDAYEHAPVGLAVCDAQARIVRLNSRLCGWAGVGKADLVGRPFYTLFAPAGRIYFETHIRPMLFMEDACEEIALDIQSSDRSRRAVFLAGRVVRDAGGAVEALHFVCTVAEQRQAYERELLAQRRNAEAYEALVAASPDAILNIGRDARINSWNGAAERLLGYTQAEAIGARVDALLAPETGFADVLARAATGEAVRVETEHTAKDGQAVPVELSAARMTDERGNVSGTVCVLRDIAARRAAEATIATLNREVLHRSKNLLAVVQGIASMTARHSAPADFTRVFSERLQSLAHSLALMVERDWSRLDLRALIEQQLAHLGSDVTSRITIDGAPVSVDADTAESLGLAVFELSTNAVKYGALAGESGALEVSWRVEGGSLALSWVESGIEGVTAPERSGFGSSLTGALLEGATNGRVEADFRPHGLAWCLTMPLTSQKAG